MQSKIIQTVKKAEYFRCLPNIMDRVMFTMGEEVVTVGLVFELF